MRGAVERFEQAFAAYVGAEHCVALVNGTATLHSALIAMTSGASVIVGVPPLTHAATTIAMIHAGARPEFVDVDPDTWLMVPTDIKMVIPVSLYGLHQQKRGWGVIDDAAQTLRKHGGGAFTSYSFQSSKLLPLGEGGALITNDWALAVRAREFSSLGHKMRDASPCIDKRALKSPHHARHHTLGHNFRMAPLVAREGLELLIVADVMLAERAKAANFYREAIDGCSWITPQHKPEGWNHDYWAFAIALESAELWHPFVEAIEHHGGERPYACWRITYQEPAFRHLAEDGTCPVAEDLQPRLVQFQTRSTEDARMNAQAVSRAIKEID